MIACFGCPPDILQEAMVLPVRIELTTSALPRMRSTTELRQHRLVAAGDRDAALWALRHEVVKAISLEGPARVR